MTPVTVIGAGLAGCECAWQLAGRGIPVRLIEMKPKKMTPAHVSENFAELVCSNSLRSDELTNAVGLLKEELRRLDSVVLASADHNRVAAGGALAVDREAFAREITERICAHPNITVERAEADAIPDGEVVIATGPLTSDAMAAEIQRLCPEFDLHFYDAVAPIVTLESVDMDSAFFASRYDKGTPDYVNCPMDQAEYTAFVQELRSAKEAPIHGFDDGAVFEGSCRSRSWPAAARTRCATARSSRSACATRAPGGIIMPSCSSGATTPRARCITLSASRRT